MKFFRDMPYPSNLIYWLFMLSLLGSGASFAKTATLEARSEGPRAEVEAKLERFHLIPAEAGITALSSPAYRAFYQSNVWVYKYLSTQAEPYSESFSKSWKKSLDLLEDLPDSDPLKNVMIAELYGKRAALEFLHENYLTSLRLVRTCRNLIRKNQKRFPDNVEQLKFLGLFNIVFAAVPKKYHWLTHTLGYKGDMDLGMRQLNKAAASSTLLRTEAHLIAFYAEKNMLAKPAQAIRRMENERKRLGASILMDFLLASAYSSLNQNEKAYGILQNRSTYANDPNVFFISYWDYMLGKSFYFREDYTKAKSYFSRFLNTHKGSLYRMDAIFRLGMTYCLSGENEKAKAYFQKMENTEASPFDEDEYAEHMARQFAKTPPSRNLKMLFRARNLFDGGYLQKAIAVLTEVQENPQPALTPGEWVELYYRFGRINHSLGNLPKASEYYKLSAAQEASSQKWMQAYSYFYLGQIARTYNRNEQAKLYYQKAMKFDDYFYQAGLENRCKTALNEL